MAGSFVAAKGFIALNNLGGSSTPSSGPPAPGGPNKSSKTEGGRGGTGSSHYGGRVDVTKTINEIKFCLSATDSSVKTADQVPKVENLILTGQKQINSECSANLFPEIDKNMRWQHLF